METRLGDGQADLPMRVAGTTCNGCAAAVSRTAQRVAIRSEAQALVLAEALTKASYPATATTG